jgi:ferredoxin-NADP reductase
MGPGSKWTIGLSIGDSATLLAPTGAFTMDTTSTRKKVFVATGTGIAPFGSMIKEYLETGGTAPLELYWGLRFEEDMFWQDMFKGFAAKYPNFVWHQVLSRPTGTWQGLTGHVTEHVVNLKQDLPSADYYLCGNKKMVDDVRTQLLAQNVPSGQIKSELFY